MTRTKSHRLLPKAFNRGVATLESTIAVSLLGLMSVAAVALMTDMGRWRGADNDEQLAAQARLALIGYAMTHHQLPKPVNAVASPARKGYLEGWLPVADLATDGATKNVRYLVDETIASDAPLYNPDPAAVAKGLLPARTARNTLDLCASLVDQEMSLQGLPGAGRAAFGVQIAHTPGAGTQAPIDAFWVGDKSDPPKDPGIQITGELLGFNELASQLGCHARLRRVSASVQSISVTSDITRLLAHQLTLAQYELDSLTWSITKIAWRQAGWMVSEATFGLRAGLAAIAMEITPAGIVPGIAELATWGVIIAAIGDLIAFDEDNLTKAKAGLPAAKKAVDQAQAKLDQARQQLAIQRQAYSTLVNSGGLQ